MAAPHCETEEPVLHALSQTTCALDAAFKRAVDDDAVRVIVLRGAGKHFNDGHDIGTPGHDGDQSFDHVQLWCDQDPVVRMDGPGVEYFAHAQELNPSIAEEFLFLGERMSTQRAHQMGTVNRVVPLDRLEAETYAMAARIAQQPRMGLALTKQVLNRIEDLQGLRAGIDLAFGDHPLAHAHNQALGGGAIGGPDLRSMVAANKPASGETR